MTGGPARRSRTTEDRPLRVRAYRPGDEDAILALFRLVFGYERTLPDWQRRFVEGPGGPAEIFLVVDGDAVVGHRAFLRLPAFVAGQACLRSITCDVMLHPQYRGRGAYGLLRDAGRAADETVAVRLSFPVDRVIEVNARHGAFDESGELPQWVRWQETSALAASRGRPLRRPGRVVASVALAVVARLAGRPRRGLEIQPMSGDEPELDDLASESRAFAVAITRRDRRYWRWRWPSPAWSLLGAHDRRGRLRGVVVGGVVDGIGRIVDLLAVDAVTTRVLLSTMADELHRAGCAVITFEYFDPRPWSRRACGRAGFVQRGRGPNIEVDVRDRDVAAAARIHAWYLTLGDSDLP